MTRYRQSTWLGLFWAALLAAACGAPRAEAQPAPGAAPKAAPQAPPAQPKPEQPPPPPWLEDPAVAAILATKPSTPAEWCRAGKIIADLGYPAPAKEFFQRVIAAKLDQKALADLERQFGPSMFAEMVTRDELAPEGRQLGRAVLDAATREIQDPQRLRSLVKQLEDPSGEVRYLAMNELRKARGAAAGPLIEALADPTRAAEHPNVRAALVELGSDGLRPLVAMLEAPEPAVQVEAARTLANLKAKEAVLYLLAPCTSPEWPAEVRVAAAEALQRLTGAVPTPQEAARLLAEAARGYFDRRYPLQSDVEGRVEFWSWDAAKKQPVAQSYPADEVARRIAARLAREAYSVDPASEEIRLLYLATMLQEASFQAGLDKPLDLSDGSPGAKAAALGVPQIERLLSYAMEHGYAPAATAAAQILGQKGSAELLYGGADPSPLVRALRDRDRRVRFAALVAVLCLKPQQPFPGESHLTEALTYFASTTGSRRALVAGAVMAESMRVGGYLEELGYTVDTALTGRDLLRQAIACPDYELALVDATLQQPTVDLLLEQLRYDCRTAGLPVGVLSRADDLDRAEHLVRNDSLAQAFPRPYTLETARWQVEQLVRRAGPAMVAFAERQRQAAQALVGLAQLGDADRETLVARHVDTAVQPALYTPGLGPSAVAVLGNLGTAESQTALVELASRSTQPFALRMAAVTALGKSIQRHGILLSKQQILQQYQRYNQSESADRQTQKVLGLVLDCIEAPTQPAPKAAKQPGG